MGYNLKRPTGLGMTEGILVPYIGMMKRQKEQFEWNHRIEEFWSCIGYTPYQNIPRVTRGFRAKTVAFTKDYDSDDSLETDLQDPADWNIFQHQEEATDDNDTASQSTDHR
ncbi:hypothetical protein AAC387_Pa03g3611 [Persea americana]